jgi:trans-feruloyl-CoA hydratase/vanillin synthase
MSCWARTPKPCAQPNGRSYDNAQDYLIRAQEAANFFDNDGRKEATRQFIDDKSFKPGLGAYDTAKQRG